MTGRWSHERRKLPSARISLLFQGAWSFTWEDGSVGTMPTRLGTVSLGPMEYSSKKQSDKKVEIIEIYTLDYSLKFLYHPHQVVRAECDGMRPWVCNRNCEAGLSEI